MLGDSITENVNVSIIGSIVTISYSNKTSDGTVRLSGIVNATSKSMSGRGQLANGTWVDWMATQKSSFTEKIADKDTTVNVYPTLDDVIYPFQAYGRKKKIH